jgi:CubicO group peptidase (beta-lactamase class C family)
MRTLKRAASPGTRWLYSTGETNLIGVLVSTATKKPLSQYLSEKIWAPFGMEQKATWILNANGNEISGCCLAATTRDFARYGLFMLADGKIGDKRVLPEGWVAAATANQAPTNRPGLSYGYQWWINGDGSYQAQGIFGQGIFIDPKRDVVIASNGNWPRAEGLGGESAARRAFYNAVQAAIDAERP